jgi:hypothetical protein
VQFNATRIAVYAGYNKRIFKAVNPTSARGGESTENRGAVCLVLNTLRVFLIRSANIPFRVTTYFYTISGKLLSYTRSSNHD